MSPQNSAKMSPVFSLLKLSSIMLYEGGFFIGQKRNC